MLRAKERTVRFTADGDEHAIGLRFDFNAMANVEEAKNDGALGGEAHATRALVHAMHRAYHQKRDEPETYSATALGSIIGEGIDVINEAIRELCGEQAEKKDPPKAAKQASG